MKLAMLSLMKSCYMGEIKWLTGNWQNLIVKMRKSGWIRFDTLSIYSLISC